MAVGCSHGDLSNRAIQEQVLAFKDRWRPDYRFELGDVLDTAALRAGAKGTSDEGRDLEPDYCAGVDWLTRYEPTHLSWGNHDARLVELAESPSATVRFAAKTLWEDLQAVVAKLGTETRNYDYEHNWFNIGGVFWGHGFWFNENAVRDHAEYLGGPVVMAHLHRPQQVSGRTRKGSQSFCVGTLADIDRMSYARRRRATASWGPGVVFGEVAEDISQLWLTSCPKGEDLRFPV